MNETTAISQDAPEINLDSELRACLIIYDIPDDSKLHNPSDFFRRIGFRVNLSCWVVPESAIPYRFLRDLRTGGANVDVVRFDAAEGPRLVRMAVANIRKELADQVKRTRESLARAESQFLANSESPTERDENERRYISRTNSQLKRLEVLMADVDNAARTFGFDPARLNLGDARAAYDAYQTGVQAKSDAYVTATNALRATGTTTGEALAKAAEMDACPPEIMADFLRDSGDDAAADAITRAFGMPGGSPEMNRDDGIFSLLSVGDAAE